MKKTLCMLTLMGASVAAIAQDNQTQRQDDGRMAAQDMINMQHTANFPILQSYVPDEVVSNAKNSYGERLYAIKQVKSGDGEDVYHVTLVDNGQTTVAWMGATGADVAYVYRTDDNSAMANNKSNTNSNAQSANTTSEPVTTEPATDDTETPVNTLDATPANPQPNTIDDNTTDEPGTTDLNKTDSTIDKAPEKTPEAGDANKPEDEDMMQ